MIKFSIVIPTFTNASGLIECLDSIIRYTDLTETEIVVVCNGAPPENARVDQLYPNTTVLWYPKPLGYSKACNAGIAAAKGEFIVLFNDDCVLLEQTPKSAWISVLHLPFKDPKVGLSGPQRAWDENSEHFFLIFFCVMIRKAVFEDIGLLDEITDLGFGEDTICCIEAERAGWRVVQVPDDDKTNELATLSPDTTLEKWQQDKCWTANFPLFHRGEQTIGFIENCDEVLNRNRAILQKRYGNKLNTERAKSVEGWFAEDEIEWITRQVAALPKGAVIVEVGAWKGRSTRAIADNLPEGAKLYTVDTFCGSSGEPDAHATAKDREGDGVYMSFYHNLHDHLDSGSVVAVRMTSEHAAETLNNLRPDMIFIDGDHSETGIKTDVEAWLPLLKEGGLICGHDYYKENEGPYWVHVRQFVEEKFPNVEKSATSIWHVRPAPRKPAVYDCFLFNDELLLLEARFTELDGVVDRWVIAEAPITHTGQPKPLYLTESIEREPERWAKWINKVSLIIVNNFPNTNDPWVRERWQRDAVLSELVNCQDDDVILIGDADEIASVEAISGYTVSQGLCRLKQRLFYCFMNLENKDGWDWQKIAPYKLIKELSPCGVRYPPAGHTPIIEGGGWHFSFCQGGDAIER